jgi:ACS family tartrate transporter-like MFS transporter
MTSGSIERQTMAQVWWHVVPIMAAALFCNVLDRINLGFAALQMNQALALTNALFGLGAGFFAVGICLFGIPSTLILHRLGARRWICVMLIVWGLCSAATAFVRNAPELLAVRLVLGMAEAGFVPGGILFLSYWFPSEYRGRALGSFIFMQPVAVIVGSPISGALLSHGGFFGLAGWQWLFIMESVPTLVLALLTFCFLTDRPSQADWLSATQKRWLAERLARETQQTASSRMSVRQTLTKGRIWALGVVYLAFAASGIGPNFFMPLIIRSIGFSLLTTGFVAAVPAIAGALTLPLWGLWADRLPQFREMIVAVAASVIAVGLLGAAALLPSPWAIVPLAVSMVGFFGFTPGFWSLPSAILTGASAAAGIAFINVLGNIGTITSPYLLGWMVDLTGSYKVGLVCLSVFAGVAAAIMTFQAVHSRNSFGQTPPEAPAPLH